jgi:hypothetical protein
MSPSIGDEGDDGDAHPSTFPCSNFLRDAGILDDFLLLDGRNGWSLPEGELDAYIEEHPQPVHEDGEETEDNSVQPSNTWGVSVPAVLF